MMQPIKIAAIFAATIPAAFATLGVVQNLCKGLTVYVGQSVGCAPGTSCAAPPDPARVAVKYGQSWASQYSTYDGGPGMAVKISTSAGASAVYELEITNAGGKVWFDIFADAGNPIQQTERQVSCKNGWDMVSCAAGSDSNPLCASYYQAPGVDPAACGDIILTLCG